MPVDRAIYLRLAQLPASLPRYPWLGFSARAVRRVQPMLQNAWPTVPQNTHAATSHRRLSPPRRTQRTLAFDADGEVTSGAVGTWTAHCVYDGLGRLVRKASGFNAQFQQTEHY
jgi:hypothetical protein